MSRKTVLYPIKVPAGAYCWANFDQTICEHYDNEHGTSHCLLGFYGEFQETKLGIKKPSKCLNLEEKKT